MIRPTLFPSLRITVIATLALAVLPIGLSAQGTSDVPEGFTPYVLEGPGISAPPLPFRIEGEHIVAPEGSPVTVTESRLTEDRLWMTMDVPGAQARYVARREGEAFTGYMFLVGGGERDAVPLTMKPASSAVELRPDPATFASAPGISRVEVVPEDASLEAGETRRFVARVYDEGGNEIADPDVEWFGGGSRVQMTGGGEFRASDPGTKQVVAMVNGAIGLAEVEVTEPKIGSIELFTDVPSRLAVGSRLPLDFDALNTVHRWVLDPDVTIESSAPAALAVEGATLVARAPGRATVTIAAGEARESFEVEVVAGEGELSITGAPTSAVPTGDVVHLSTTIDDAVPVWAVAGGEGAEVWPDGAFVAERAGTYTVIATLDDRVATAEVTAEPRGASGRIHMAGHGLNTDTFTSDLWPQNAYVYVGTHQANELLTYDVSDPANPVLTDEQAFDARVVNDVKVSEDGAWLVATREGAANRRNGILVFSLEDPSSPRLVSEYTETLTAGVHNVFWVGSLVYAVNDGTGDMHVIDLADPENPEQVGRWGLPVEGRSLHDIWVQDGIAYLSYLGDGLVILDVGSAGHGGTPTEPVMVSRIFYPGGPTHTAMRYGDYVFVGDEDFSLQGTTPSVLRSDPRGPIHVIDVSDLANPRYVAKYEVPEAGAHNIWIEDDVLYAGYYQGGIRVVDISGELRGDLYEQGREIAYFLPAAGFEEAKKPYAPRTWGVFPMFTNGWGTTGETFYATDYNSGLWSFTVEMPEEPIS